MVRARWSIGLLATVLSACLPGGGRRPPPVAPATAPGEAPLNVAGPWRAGIPVGSESVTIVTRALVEISSDSSVRVDTLHATLSASYSWTGSTPRRVDGQITDFRVAVGTAVAAVPPGLRLARPFSASAPAATGSMSFTLPSESSACTDPALSSMQGLQDAWVSLPAALSIGLEWTDTVHTTSCRDRVLLRGTSVRRFVVRRAEVEDERRLVVLVERTARGRLAGEGEQFGEKVAIGGESSGTMLYVFSPTTGRFVRATGTSTLSFSLRSSRRNQTVRQSSAVSIAW